MSFLPQDYVAPKGESRYLKIKDGDSIRLRILTSPLMSWVWFTADKKPVRVLYDGSFVKTPDNIPLENKSKFSWAMVIWNYNTERTEIWDVTQATLRGPLENFASDPDIGDPKTYDLKISRKGTTMEDTEYTITPLMKADNMKEISKEILKNANSINLNALLTGLNPFESEIPLEDLRDPSEGKSDGKVSISDVPF